MAESAPLLPDYSPGSPVPKASSPSSVDNDISSELSSSSNTDIAQAFLISLACAFDAQQTFITVFTDAEPTWHCTAAADPACSSAHTPCSLPAASWVWDQPPHTSVVSEWSLQCSGPAAAGLPASAYFTGCLAGGLVLATLADSLLGRKNMLFLSCLTMSLSGMATAASPNIWAYAVLRLVSGVGRATIGTSAIVLASETVRRRWRDRISIAGLVCFTLGFLSLPGMAYLSRGSSWRNLYLWASLPCLCYSIAGYFLVRESPRWLSVRALTRGREVDIFSALRLLLLEKGWASRRLVAAMTVGFGIGIVYYGMPLSLGNLGYSNLYLSMTLNALAEMPSSLITYFLVGMLDRRATLLVLTTVSGASSLLCIGFAGREGWRMAAEVVSFFSGCTACNVVLIYSVVLFPTCVRNSVVSMVRQALVFGGVCVPVLIAAAGRDRSYLSFGVFGVVIGCCGLFVGCLLLGLGRKLFLVGLGLVSTLLTLTLFSFGVLSLSLCCSSILMEVRTWVKLRSG